MSAGERQQQFERAIRALPDVSGNARIGLNFGFSNSARVLEGGLFACTSNIGGPSMDSERRGRVTEFLLLCVLTFPPMDEVYFGIRMTAVDALNHGFAKLAGEAERKNAEKRAAGKSEGKINNNIKFYITDDGQLFFHNDDFKESLIEARERGELDPDCLVPIDAIHFAIWPPAASARRSLLARQFVGYLGGLIGREKVHEIKAWDEAGTVGPLMRRMPASLAIADIERDIAALGGHYPHSEVRRYHAALNHLKTKHFVILTGLSGTGKTRLALQYAAAVHGVTEADADPFVTICPVRPEWTDPTGLTGYYDVLSGRYVVPPFLEAVLLALAHPASPVFVLLDEMNLARVEYYFSDLLSALETGRPITLHASGVPLEGSNGTSVPAEIPLPSNLFITGTINIDETTNPVSDKVLDRAVVIDMSQVDLTGFLAALGAREPALELAIDSCRPALTAAHAILSEHGLGFGYRVAEEVIRYHAFAAESLGDTPAQIIDDLMVQKVLVKLRGSGRQQPLLAGLGKALTGMQRCARLLERLNDDLDEFGSFQANR